MTVLVINGGMDNDQIDTDADRVPLLALWTLFLRGARLKFRLVGPFSFVGFGFTFVGFGFSLGKRREYG